MQRVSWWSVAFVLVLFPVVAQGMFRTNNAWGSSGERIAHSLELVKSFINARDHLQQKTAFELAVEQGHDDAALAIIQTIYEGNRKSYLDINGKQLVNIVKQLIDRNCDKTISHIVSSKEFFYDSETHHTILSDVISKKSSSVREVLVKSKEKKDENVFLRKTILTSIIQANNSDLIEYYDSGELYNFLKDNFAQLLTQGIDQKLSEVWQAIFDRLTVRHTKELFEKVLAYNTNYEQYVFLRDFDYEKLIATKDVQDTFLPVLWIYGHRYSRSSYKEETDILNTILLAIVDENDAALLEKVKLLINSKHTKDKNKALKEPAIRRNYGNGLERSENITVPSLIEFDQIQNIEVKSYKAKNSGTTLSGGASYYTTQYSNILHYAVSRRLSDVALALINRYKFTDQRNILDKALSNKLSDVAVELIQKYQFTDQKNILDKALSNKLSKVALALFDKYDFSSEIFLLHNIAQNNLIDVFKAFCEKIQDLSNPTKLLDKIMRKNYYQKDVFDVAPNFAFKRLIKDLFWDITKDLWGKDWSSQRPIPEEKKTYWRWLRAKIKILEELNKQQASSGSQSQQVPDSPAPNQQVPELIKLLPNDRNHTNLFDQIYKFGARFFHPDKLKKDNPQDPAIQFPMQMFNNYKDKATSGVKYDFSYAIVDSILLIKDLLTTTEWGSGNQKLVSPFLGSDSKIDASVVKPIIKKYNDRIDELKLHAVFKIGQTASAVPSSQLKK